MNRSAYFTTGLAIKLFSRLSKADVVLHGRENLPPGPRIFVINHFTRIETLLLPYYIYSLTEKPVWSLAAADLFQGGLEKFFDMVGVISTGDPQRDQHIVRSLLTNEADWIIFPEGSMVKTKKIIDGGKYMIANPKGMRPPHTGAAALGLRAELFRRYLETVANANPGQMDQLRTVLQIEDYAPEKTAPISIVPVNLTYYPIRAAQNIASTLMAKLVKDLSDRAVEEIMTEGTMMLSGVDLDIRIGKPITMGDYLKPSWFTENLSHDSLTGFGISPALKEKMRKTAREVMQRYMHDIYAMTTVNHEHLFASLLRLCPLRRMRERDFLLRSFYAATLLSRGRKWNSRICLHKSLMENQAHLLTDDRFHKYENFLKLAEEKSVVRKEGEYLLRNRKLLTAPLSFHRGRIENTIEVIANEVEPLQPLLSLIRSLAWQPLPLLRLRLVRLLLKLEKHRYGEEYAAVADSEREQDAKLGGSFLLPSYSRQLGIVLIHSYLAVPEEVRALGKELQKRGFWVYCVRLPGHGTSAFDLAGRHHREWFEAVESGYVLLRNVCRRVAIGGVAVGGSLALALAARNPEVAGVVAVCPPYGLRSYASSFMPVRDVLDRLLLRLKRGEEGSEFLPFSHGNPHINYSRNPVHGVKEVGELLDSLEDLYKDVTQPTLILQGNRNPVVDPKSSRQVYDALGTEKKEFCLLNYDRHVLVYGEGAGTVRRKIVNFFRDLV